MTVLVRMILPNKPAALEANDSIGVDGDGNDGGRPVGQWFQLADSGEALQVLGGDGA